MAQEKAASQPLIRISKIGDHFLVFDADDVERIRRNHNICAILAGSTPQNPNQNIFLSLPLELLPEEAAALLEQKVALLVDEASFHLQALLHPDRSTRKAYLGSLRNGRAQARKGLAEEQAQKEARSRELAQKAREKGKGKEKNKNKNKNKKQPAESEAEAAAPIAATAPADDDTMLFAPDEEDVSAVGRASPSQEAKQETARKRIAARPLTLTPTTSAGLTLPESKQDTNLTSQLPPATWDPEPPLHKFLLSRGYFMTPGLRFGATYSVYPGDPLRFHAHFLATEYGWDEEIPVLDLVGTGRLGTSVKKGVLIGGEVPDQPLPDGSGNQVRAFCIEWAGM